MSSNVGAKKSEESEGGFWKYAIAAGVGVAAAGLAYAVGHANGVEECQKTNSNACQMRKGGNCAVCLDQVQALKVLNCGHSFHEECIQQWLVEKRTCPVCRAKQ